MKPLVDQDHYEVLEISRDASPAEIERAYQMAASTYDEASLAAYSVFGDEEVRELRRRVDLAYRVLADEGARREYDRSLRGATEIEMPPPILIEMEPDPAPRRTLEPLLESRVAPALEHFEEVDDEGSSTSAFDGSRLRRSRLRRGIDLEQIATTTKINPTYLRCIEDERFEDLPAPVYVRGFVSAYARCVGLDPGAVTTSYMARFDEARATVQVRRGRH